MNIEKRSIEFIPENERHGNAKSLITMWFSANMQLMTLVTGALAVTMGLNLFWSVVAILAGNGIGGIFMASHSAQGPKLGIPQMIQSRAQFGVKGAVIPLIVVILMYIGFFSAVALLGAEGLSAVTPIPMNWSLVGLSVITLIFGILGYDFIHSLEKYLSFLSTILFGIATILVLTIGVPAGSWSMGDFHFVPFMLFLSIIVTWQVGFGPYVADYSRYLPSKTSTSKTFWYTYFGSVIGAVWMMTLGVLLTLAIPDFMNNSTLHFANMFGSNFSVIVVLALILGIVALNVLNIYGTFMSITTTLVSFVDLRITPKLRAWLLFVAAFLGTAIAIGVQNNLQAYYTEFMIWLAYFLLPWSSINLTDYYFLRKGEYSVKDIFDVNGIYGKYNWISLIVYLFVVMIEIPFMHTSMYKGPIANALDGADITWIVGIFLPGILYYYPMKLKLNQMNLKLVKSNIEG
ncbi:cytosine permease [Bacillus salipaludis]|uniref:Cytosine permease n=1 Tax=Bacillus salipaludis TaxID=2547811 RepID=A0A4V3AUE0_9BACI|nr:cytosine permease [Bacillus salipaludis]MDQ6594920.1 cytosine permease [Bacillus salipaludis]TDK64199.1 cytosine permease [Bacillus salipaludis]